MNEYHKIQSVYKRDINTKKFIIGEYSTDEIEYLKNNIWVFTEKIDGTNIRIMWEDKILSFGGKTEKAIIPPFLIDKLNEIFQLDKFESLFADNSICLYGEGYGKKIQKGNKYISDGVSFVLFDIKIGMWWLKREDIEKIAKQLNIDIVPIIGEGTLDDGIKMCQDGFKSQWGDFIAEGLVLRPKVELKSRNGSRIVSKIKYKDWQ